jgi:CHAT domain-containing protein/Flp pilus assembly protein TadD
VYEAQARFAEAKKIYKGMLAMATSAQENTYWSTVGHLVDVYGQLQEIDSALLFLDNVRLLRSDNMGRRYRYELDLLTARIKREHRQYDDASILLGSLVNQYHKTSDPELYPLYLRAVVETGKLQGETGNFGDAERFLLQALDGATNAQPTDRVLVIGVRNDLAAVYERIGLYDKSIDYYNSALDLYRSSGSNDRIAMATLLSNIAGVRLKLGATRLAIDGYKEVLKMLEGTVPESNSFLITLLSNIATAYRKDKAFSASMQHLDRAYRLVEKYPTDQAVTASVLNNMAVLLTAQGEVERAIDFYERAYEIKRKLYGDHSIMLRDLAGNMAVVYWALKMPDRSLPLFQLSNALSLKEINYVFPNLSEAEQIQFYEQLKEDFERYASVAFQSAAGNPGMLTQVFNNQVTIKSILFFTQQQRQVMIAQLGDSSLLRDYNKLRMLREQLGYAYQQTLSQVSGQPMIAGNLEREIDALEKSLSVRTGKTLSEKMTGNSTTWPTLQAGIKPDEAIVEMVRYRKYDLKAFYEDDLDRVSFGFTDSIYYAALITTGETKKHPRIVRMNEGRNLETRFLSYYRNTMFFDVPDKNSYEQYWKPIESAIGDKTRIYFSGDGVYHRINLNTIKRPDGKYLLEAFDIHYLLNPSQFLDKSTTSFTAKTALLFGDPDFYLGSAPAPAKSSDFQPLPATKVEVSTIDQLLQQKSWHTQTYLNAQATERNLKAAASPDILHVATHGFFSDEKVSLNTHARRNFLFHSGVALAGANNQNLDSANNVREDGILTAYEVMNLNLGKTHLVVLSACETGLGKIENGEGVYGLQRAFLQAGARNIVISLWKVDDVVTKNLMVKFYQYLFENHTEREALKLAQRDLIPARDNPLDWGAFIILGAD